MGLHTFQALRANCGLSPATRASCVHIAKARRPQSFGCVLSVECWWPLRSSMEDVSMVRSTPLALMAIWVWVAAFPHLRKPSARSKRRQDGCRSGFQMCNCCWQAPAKFNRWPQKNGCIANRRSRATRLSRLLAEDRHVRAPPDDRPGQMGFRTRCTRRIRRWSLQSFLISITACAPEMKSGRRCTSPFSRPSGVRMPVP